MTRVDGLGRGDAWEGVKAVVAGMGVSGFAAADNLTHVGAHVLALDELEDADRTEKATILSILGADVRLAVNPAAGLPADYDWAGVDVLVVSPEVLPTAPLVEAAIRSGVPVWSEVELAWRLRDRDTSAPWLAVTGGQGRSTTVRILDSILRTARKRSVVCGSSGLPVVEAVMDPDPYDVYALDLSSAQLRFTSSMSCESAVVLNVADSAPEWYPSSQEYAADLGRVYEGVRVACVYNVQDETTEFLVREADVVEGARAIGVTLGMPGVGMLGIVDGILADRAFIELRQTNAAELGTVGDLGSDDPQLIVDALSAAALARAHGVPPVAVRDGLRGFQPDS